MARLISMWWLANEWALRRHQLFDLIGIARVLGTFALGCAGLYGAIAPSAHLWMQIQETAIVIHPDR
jgi:hypothetical protein